MLRRLETKRDLNPGLTQPVRREQTEEFAAPLPPKKCRLQVRFLSHLPASPEIMQVADLCLQYNMCALTPI